MPNLIYDSGLLNFSNSENQFVTVQHNLGKKPPIIQFVGEKDGEVGFPCLVNEQNQRVTGPYLGDTTDFSALKVYKPDVYTYTGQFRIRIFER